MRKLTFLLFFHRLPGYIVELYSITLMALFMGCTGAICLTLLIIHADLAQVFFYGLQILI